MMKKILIVDDEPNIVMALEYTFKKNNFEVFIARDGQEALEILEKQLPDVIILDVMMPVDRSHQRLCVLLPGDRRTRLRRLRPLSGQHVAVVVHIGHHHLRRHIGPVLNLLATGGLHF